MWEIQAEILRMKAQLEPDTQPRDGGLVPERPSHKANRHTEITRGYAGRSESLGCTSWIVSDVYAMHRVRSWWETTGRIGQNRCQSSSCTALLIRHVLTYYSPALTLTCRIFIFRSHHLKPQRSSITRLMRPTRSCRYTRFAFSLFSYHVPR